MIKASALYIVIIISLVIAVLCSSLIVTAYYYRSAYQKKFRYDLLQNNLNSGINILLASPDSTYKNEKTFSLFGRDNDSVSLQKASWGIFEINIAKSFIQHDTLYKTFLTANTIDSTKWAAFYIVDEDRPVSVSGKTIIIGDAYLPKAGITEAYVDGKKYEGDKRLVIGKKYQSGKQLPALDTTWLKQLNLYFTAKGDSVFSKDSITRSFLQPAKIFNFKKEVKTLDHIKLKGNITLHSDTTLIINSSAKLDNVLVFAPTIIVKSGFIGNCQLFATDSVSIGKSCRFEYPSCVGIIRSISPKVKVQAKVVLGENTVFSGLIFTYEKTPGSLKPLISIGKKDTIRGQIYSQNILELKDSSVVAGSVSAGSLLYRTSFTLYENYLINVSLDSKLLSPYYLTSAIMPASGKKKKILQWLEGN